MTFRNFSRALMNLSGFWKKQPGKKSGAHPVEASVSKETTVLKEVTIPREVTNPEGTAIPAKVTVPEEATIPEVTMVSEEVTIPEETMASEAATIQEEATIPEETTIPEEATALAETAISSHTKGLTGKAAIAITLPGIRAGVGTGPAIEAGTEIKTAIETEAHTGAAPEAAENFTEGKIPKGRAAATQIKNQAINGLVAAGKMAREKREWLLKNVHKPVNKIIPDFLRENSFSE